MGMLVGVGIILNGPDALHAEDITATARLLPSGDGLELEYRSEGYTWKDLLPVYRIGGVRYFSAGVGLAERRIEYPPFPLKIVLTAGGKPYVTRADVHLVRANGEPALSIPADHVTGPWLFVDLPPGIYDITGNRDATTVRLRGVNVSHDHPQTVYLRFPEDTNP